MTCGDWRKKASHRVTVQSKTLVRDNYGGSSVTWSDVGTYWASIEPLSGREIYMQDQHQSKVNSKMTIRYQSALKDTATTGGYRIQFDGRLFPIVYVRNLSDDMKNEGKTFQQLFVTENEAENG